MTLNSRQVAAAANRKAIAQEEEPFTGRAERTIDDIARLTGYDILSFNDDKTAATLFDGTDYLDIQVTPYVEPLP